MRHTFTRIRMTVFAALLCAALLCTAISPAFAADAAAPLPVGVISDIHYYSEKCTGNWCDEFMRFANSNAYQRYETPALLDSALAAMAAHAEEKGLKYVLLPGDLTANGEYDNHVELAERLKAFEERTGIPVIAICGNHDINNYHGFTYENGKKEDARITTPEEFREIYQDLGYDLAYHTYTPKSGKAGMLSYSVRLDGGYRLLVLDTNKYSADITANQVDKNQTEGCITKGLMEWALSEIEDAKRSGEAVIGMEHHGIVDHFEIQSSIFKAFLVDSWRERAEALADAGLHYMLTGHMHDTSITDWVTDKGNVIYDISTASLSGFPNYFREIVFDNTTGSLTANVETLDVDCAQPVTVRGEAYETPYKLTHSFEKTFSKDGLVDLAMRYLGGTLDSFFDAVESQGTIIAALQSEFGLDVEKMVSQLVNVHVGSIDIFTSTNIMSFLDDLDAQIRKEILPSREDAQALIGVTIQKLLDLQVSDLPCTRYIERYGFGDPNRPGTLEDAAYNAIAILYEGNQSIDDDPFMQDVIDFFRNRDGAQKLVQQLYDVVVNDLLQDTVLGNLQVRVDTLFPCGTLGHVSAVMLDNFLTLLFRGDKSYTNVINSFLRLGLLPEYDSINGIADHFMNAYLTDSAMQALGETLGYMIEDLVTDHGDGEDLCRTLTDAKHEVIATRENYRLPSIVTMTVGDDETTRQFSWYTIFSTTGCDIEIIPYSDNPRFSGTPTKTGVKAKNAQEYLLYPGVNLGFAGFLRGNIPLMHHTLTVSGLEKGKKYSYRVGDAKKGWWSEAGVIDLTENGTFTFLHVTDAEAFNTAQYERTTHRVLRTAYGLYPQAGLILSSGNQVYDSTNVNQWKDFADTSSDVLMRVPFMPASGTAENSGVLTRYFILPGVPEQSGGSGTYYAFDRGGVHFMVLNTNDATAKNGLSEQQLSWLQTSAKESDAKWKVVVLHKAIYSNGGHYSDKEVAAMRNQFKRLFPTLGIDLVLEGQDHVYVRTQALYNGLPLKTHSETVEFGGSSYASQTAGYGTYYVLSGAAGAVAAGKTENVGASLTGAVCRQPAQPVFSAVQIDGDKLYFDAYAVNDDGTTERIDAFALDKSSDKKTILPCEDDVEPVLLTNPEDLDAIDGVQAAIDVYEGELIPDDDDVEYPTDASGNVVISDEPTTSSGSGSGSSDNGAGNSSGSGSAGVKIMPGAQTTTAPNRTSGSGSASDGSGSTPGANGTGGNGTAGAGNSSGYNGDGGSGGTSGVNGASGAFGASGGYTAGGNTAGGAGTNTASGGTGGGNTAGTNTRSGVRVGANGIPLLGGSAPVTVMCVLFGAMLVGLSTAGKRKKDE